MKKRKVLLIVLLIVASFPLFAQIVRPVSWTVSQKAVGNGEIELGLKASIQPGWHLYSTKLPEGGPVKTTFTFTPDSGRYKVIGEVSSITKPTREHDQIFNMDLEFYSNEAIF